MAGASARVGHRRRAVELIAAGARVDRRRADAAPWLDRTLYPYEQRRIDIDGNEVAYVDEGQGHPLLMLHGNPTWSFLYRDVIAGLAGRFRCVAPDLPGFGFSRAASGYTFTPERHSRVVERFVAALDLRNVTLLVHDWGGAIGLRVAERAPERFRALVVGNTFAWPVDDDPHWARFSKVVGGPLGRMLIVWANAFVNLLVPAGTRRRRPSRAVMAAYRGPFRRRADRLPMAIFPREIRASHDYLAEVERGLPAIRHLPVLIVWGDRDMAYRARERERFEELFPDHRTVILRGAGHYIQEDAAGEIVTAISDWPAVA